MLHVSPLQLGVCLQHEGDDPGGHGRAGAGPRVARGAAVVEVRGDHLPLPAAAAAVGRGHRAGASLAVPAHNNMSENILKHRIERS